ncbi:hypothetical protein M3936_00070 [Sutcliffiella horikoshii]|uniref:hypothetical protein n=1 Tax=Sutcliffiella horikoshii TaxID=79883 RepID=UPI00203A65C4|nr:hypothetical protein [Sutcliffiella horikoshii]MCM3615963.1 hypothetical protein [Sutcliffiella horikoshii]
MVNNRNIKRVANKFSFGLTLILLVVFILFISLVTNYEYYNLIYYLVPLLLISFFLSVFGLPFEEKNDKFMIIRSGLSLVISFILIIVIGILYVAPIIFPFGIPPQ